jgi:hypothetical protein
MVEFVSFDEQIYSPEGDPRRAAYQLTTDQFRSTVTPGASGEPANTSASGTMGASVCLSKDGTDIGRFALSNHHVIRKDCLDSGKRPVHPQNSFSRLCGAR